MIFRWCWRKKTGSASRSVQMGGSNNGLVVTGDVGTLNVQYSGSPAPNESVLPEKLTDQQLREIAAKLLRAGQPPSLSPLPIFRNASDLAKEALKELADVPRFADELSGEAPRSVSVIELMVNDSQHCLLTAPPGSGKTHALWHAAQDVLAKGSLIPIFITTGRLNTWAEVCAAVADVAGNAHVEGILRDSRVCVVLDGWSEFASGLGLDDRAKMVRVLSDSRVVANGRLGTSADSFFKMWRLQPLPIAEVMRAVRTALPGNATPDSALVELLRLPLALTLFILLGGQDRSRGKLLSRFHAHLSLGFPDRFTDILTGAVAAVELSNQQRSYDRLEREVRDRAKDASLNEPLAYLNRLGLLEDNGGKVVPIHDLYWSWLSGNGLLEEGRVSASLRFLSTRENYELALESGSKTDGPTIEATQKTDAILAAQFNAYVDDGCSHENEFKLTLQSMFDDERLVVRYRAALSGLYSRDPKFLRPSLDVIAVLHDARVFVPAFNKALAWANLYEYRDIVFEWLGAPGSEQLLEAIALNGDEKWLEWLEQAANARKPLIGSIVACALSCCGYVPSWTLPHLTDLAKDAAWKLQQVTSRGANNGLAQWLAENYEACIGQQNGGFFHINKLLVACGDDSVFERLLFQFPSMAESVQDRLGFAIVEKGEAWIAKFQRAAFQNGMARAC